MAGNLLEPLSSAAMEAHKLLWPNRAADPKQEDVLDRAYPCFKHQYEGERSDNWCLEWLGVDPGYQGKGYGRDLVAWGLKKAKEENVWATVIAARGKDRFYQNCGFEFIDGSGKVGEGNPLADVEGANMHWKAPVGNDSHVF